MSCATRSAYVSRLRRAFLLRVHPDRFVCTAQRAEQAAFVQAFHQRITAVDFLEWQRQRTASRSEQTKANSISGGLFSFLLERRDGTIVQRSLKLDDSVSNILGNMANVLIESGVASIPLPPQEDQIDATSLLSKMANSNEFSRVVRQNVPLSRRKTLHHFLRSIDPVVISSRQQARWDAKMVASVARREFGFIAVDATQTRWSSSTVAALLRRFVEVSKSSFQLRIKSFYPLRLIWSPTAKEVPTDNGSSVDLYDGTLRLNPSATSVQWVQTLRTVTDSTIQKLHQNLQVTENHQDVIQMYFGGGIKFRKGFTCSSVEYFECLERLSCALQPSLIDRREKNHKNLSNISLSTVTAVVVESELVGRRPLVTSSGDIQIGCFMGASSIVEAISDLGIQAREKTVQQKMIEKTCKGLIVQLQQVLGLQRVYLQSKSVSQDEFRDCLSRLLQLAADDTTGSLLSGHSLGVANIHQSFHIADDGSLVIPHNWH